jgi:hypothetical protein
MIHTLGPGPAVKDELGDPQWGLWVMGGGGVRVRRSFEVRKN